MHKLTYNSLFRQLSNSEIENVKKNLNNDLLCLSSGDKRLKFFNFIESFFLQKDLYKNNKRCFVAVSGGADSVFLAIIIYFINNRLKIYSEVNLIHINHGTRDQCDLEELFVRNLSAVLNFNFLKKNYQSKHNNVSHDNFEDRARKFRYKVFEDLSNGICPVYLGHNIDDSIEWWLMQNFKSSTSHYSSLIPLVRKNYYRPLHCVSKVQIRNLLKSFNFVWCEDDSNKNLKFERNLIRNKVLNNISMKYPKFVKNFVNRQNVLLKNLEKHRKKMNDFREDIVKFHGCLGEKILLLKTGLEEVEEVIIEEVLNYSNAKRGSIFNQKMILNRSFKKNKFGPIDFSGGVKVFIVKNMLCIVNDEVLNNYKTQEQIILKKLEHKLSFPSMKLRDFEIDLFSHSAIEKLKDLYFPYVFFVDEDQIDKKIVKKYLRQSLMFKRLSYFMPILSKKLKSEKIILICVEDLSRIKKLSTKLFNQLLDKKIRLFN